MSEARVEAFQPTLFKGVRELTGLQSRMLLASVALGLLSFLAFSNTFTNRFVVDDRAVVVENKFVQNFEVWKFFSTGYWAGAYVDRDNTPLGLGGVYRPLVLLTYALNYWLGGLNVVGYHAFNLLLHITVSCLLYIVARQLGCSWQTAVAAAALFAIHPLHTEAVTAIYGRPELLMALGVLASLSAYIAGLGAESNAGGRSQGLLRSYRFVSLAAFGLGLLSKEQAVMLPALFVLYDVSGTERQGSVNLLRRALLRYLPYAALLVLYIIARSLVLGLAVPPGEGTGLLNNPLLHVNWEVRVLTAMKIAGKYLWLCVWPARLAADYSYDSIPVVSSIWDGEVLGSFLAWMGLAGLGVWSYVRRDRVGVLGVGLTILTFLPASNLLVPIGTIMAERLFYLPLAGLALLAGAGWGGGQAWLGAGGRLWKSGLAWLALAAVVSSLMIRTVLRNRDWYSNETLFRSALRVVPENAKVHYNLGVVEKDPRQALKYFEKAVEIYPDYEKKDGRASLQIGFTLLKADRVDEAVVKLEQAARLEPKLRNLFPTLGLAYMKQGRWDDAEAAYRNALALDLKNSRIHNDLSFVLWKQGRYEEALAAAEAAINLSPDFPEAHYNRGAALEAMGRLGEAVAVYKRALELRPGSSVRRSLERVSRQLGR